MDEQESLLSQQVYAALNSHSNSSARSAQQQDFQIGVSDLGVCPERVRRMLAQIPEPPTDKFAAFIGTAVGDHAEAAVQAAYPEAIRHATITTELSCGKNAYSVSGHPDLVMPWGVIDIKTTDGLEVVRRTGPDMQQFFQRHIYTKGAWEAGLLGCELEVARTANVWVDRSGSTKECFTHMDTYNPLIVEEAAAWLDEVFYCFDHGVEARKEPPREWCKVACGHFDTCRAYDSDVSGLITDEKLLTAVDMYREGTDLIRSGKGLQKEAKTTLEGVEGYTDKYQVRWTQINESVIETFTRAGYSKLSITKVR